MKLVNLDKAPASIKKFLRGLLRDKNGAELELDGKPFCQLLPPSQLTEPKKLRLLQRISELLGRLPESAKEAIRDRGWQLARRAQERNKGTPARVVAREVRRAVEAVRRRQR